MLRTQSQVAEWQDRRADKGQTATGPEERLKRAAGILARAAIRLCLVETGQETEGGADQAASEPVPCTSTTGRGAA